MPYRFLASLFLGAMAVVSFGQVTGVVAPAKHKFPPTPKLEVAAPLQPTVVVQLKEGENAALFAATHGLKPLHPFASDPNTWVMAAASVKAATDAARSLAADGSVARVYQDRKMPAALCWAPNDPYFFPNAAQGLQGQWHLRNVNNVGGANIDARVWGAWQRDITGQGVTIGICDNAMEPLHPDLAPNFDQADSWNFAWNWADVSPTTDADLHGISVAGVAAARGGNGVGLTGAAPFANIAGLRLPFNDGGVLASAWEDAIKFHSSGDIRTIQIKNHSYSITYPYIDDGVSVAALEESLAAGTVHVWAAGNYRFSPGGYPGFAEDSNKLGTQSTPGLVVVSALGADGVFSYYSNYGANIAVTAPSSSVVNGITTTDRMGPLGYGGHPDDNYTTGFGGTSSASPLVAGVMALVKQVQPALDGRMAKHLLAISSDVVNAKDTTDTSDGGWRANKAGVKFNQNYGFGLVDADRLTANAVSYLGVTPLETEDTGTINVNANIPDNKPSGLVRSFTINKSIPIEEMVFTFTVTHPYIGDLKIYLTSPSGTKSRLVSSNYQLSDSYDHLTWRSSDNAFWGENPHGTWKVTAVDVAPEDAGMLNSFRAVARMGTLVPIPPDYATFVSQNTPTSVFHGNSFNVKLTFKNAGTTTWSREGGYLLKSVAAPFDTWGLSKVYFNTPVAPGQSATILVKAKAPAIQGHYTFSWSLGKTSGAVFGKPSTPVSISVD